MAKYRVIKAFVDLQDGNYRYEAGDIYPRKGKKTTKKRVAELSSTENKRHTVMIEPIEDEDEV